MVIWFKTIIKTYLFSHWFNYLKNSIIDEAMSEWKNRLDQEFNNSYYDETNCTG